MCVLWTCWEPLGTSKSLYTRPREPLHTTSTHTQPRCMYYTHKHTHTLTHLHTYIHPVTTCRLSCFPSSWASSRMPHIYTVTYTPWPPAGSPASQVRGRVRACLTYIQLHTPRDHLQAPPHPRWEKSGLAIIKEIIIYLGNNYLPAGSSSSSLRKSGLAIIILSRSKAPMPSTWVSFRLIV